MKRIAGVFTILTVLMLVCPHPAQAQFWKKLFGKESTKHKRPERKPLIKKTEADKPSKKKKEIYYPVSEKKSRYRVDVVMPLYLDELVKNDKPTFKGKVPDKAAGGLEFYEGMQIAADSLRTHGGYNIDIYIHDIAETTPEKLAAGRELDSTDLIIGLLQSAQIPPLAAYAQKKQVNFISALSPSDADITNNPYFILMQPTLKTHCAFLMERVKKKYKTNPLILYRTSLGVAEEAYNYIIEDADRDATKILCNTLPTRQQLEPLFDSTKVNVIVMALMESNYAEKMLQQLYEWFPGYTFDVYGMPSWRTMSSLRKPDAYPNVAVFVTTPFYFENSTPWTQSLVDAYKTRYGSAHPGELVYRGYETMYWLSQLLKKHGAVFNEKMDDNSQKPFTKYDIKPQWDKNDNLLYLENEKLYMLRYQSSSYMVEP